MNYCMYEQSSVVSFFHDKPNDLATLIISFIYPSIHYLLRRRNSSTSDSDPQDAHFLLFLHIYPVQNLCKVLLVAFVFQATPRIDHSASCLHSQRVASSLAASQLLDDPVSITAHLSKHRRRRDYKSVHYGVADATNSFACPALCRDCALYDTVHF